MAKRKTFPGSDVLIEISGNFPEQLDNSNKPIQLYENEIYEYKLIPSQEDQKHYQLEANGIVFNSKIHKNSGLIKTNTNVGFLSLRLYCKDESTCNGEYTYTGNYLTVEVQSLTIDYKTHYQNMLKDITEKIADLQLQLSSPVYLHLQADIEKNQASPIQKLFFLLSLIEDEKFNQALNMILNRPNSRWSESLVSQDSRRAKSFSGRELRQLVSSSHKISVPTSHPLYKKCQTIADKIETFSLVESIDTVENRFVKHVLTFFAAQLDIFEQAVIKLGSKNYQAIIEDAHAGKQRLHSYLHRDFFKKVSVLTTMPSNSPILQRKEGYREVLKKWIQYRLGSNIQWDGSEDVYKGGQRNLAALYEYWCFFKLLSIMEAKFKVGNSNLSNLIGETESGFGIKLKAGKTLSLQGIYENELYSKKLNIKFSYNRTFSPKKSIKEAGTWTLTMRPDYTISFWPLEMKETEAEALKLITHVHFDAKYKVDVIENLFKDQSNLLDVANDIESDEVTENTTKNSKEAKTVKNIDILKMHSYRDAIRRTGGAYVLYPGDRNEILSGFHELLPGLGAFPLRPEDNDGGVNDIGIFLEKLVKFLCDRISQWEYSSFYEYEVHKEDQYKHGDIPPWNFDYNLLFQTGRRPHPQHVQKRMHNTYILKLVPDNKGRKFFITNDCFYVPLEYDSFDIKHIGDLRYVVGKNQDGIITLWEVKDPVVESKDNLDDDTKLELQDNVNTFIKYLAIEKEMLLTKFTPNEIYNLISKLQKNFVSLEYLFQNKK